MTIHGFNDLKIQPSHLHFVSRCFSSSFGASSFAKTLSTGIKVSAPALVFETLDAERWDKDLGLPTNSSIQAAQSPPENAMASNMCVKGELQMIWQLEWFDYVRFFDTAQLKICTRCMWSFRWQAHSHLSPGCFGMLALMNEANLWCRSAMTSATGKHLWQRAATLLDHSRQKHCH